MSESRARGLKSAGPHRFDEKQDKRIIQQLRRNPDSWAAQLWKLRADTKMSGGAVQNPMKGLQAYSPWNYGLGQ